MTLTRWINEAITEKLDKLSPETAGVSPMVEKPVSTFDPMAKRRQLLRLQQGPSFIGPYLRYYPKGCDTHTLAEDMDKKMGSGSPGMEAIIEDLCIGSGMEMTLQQKGAVLAAHARAEKELAERAEKLRKEQEQEIAELKALRDAPQINPHIALRAKAEAAIKAKHEKWLAERETVEEPAPLVNVAAPAMGDEADFWGDDDDGYAKIKAMARKP